MSATATTLAGWIRSWPAAPERVAEVRDAVTAFARGQGVSELQTAALRLAVSEACANVVMHAPGSGDFAVAVERRDAAVEVTVRDRGAGMRPRADSPGAGLGLGIIAALVDELEVRTPPGGVGTELRMRVGLRG